MTPPTASRWPTNHPSTKRDSSPFRRSEWAPEKYIFVGLSCCSASGGLCIMRGRKGTVCGCLRAPQRVASGTILCTGQIAYAQTYIGGSTFGGNDRPEIMYFVNSRDHYKGTTSRDIVAANSVDGQPHKVLFFSFTLSNSS